MPKLLVIPARSKPPVSIYLCAPPIKPIDSGSTRTGMLIPRSVGGP